MAIGAGTASVLKLLELSKTVLLQTSVGVDGKVFDGTATLSEGVFLDLQREITKLLCGSSS